MAPFEDASLRAEHDTLAARVSARSSIDDVRRGAYASFGFVISTGLAVKFAWDRWGSGPRPARIPGRYPLLFLGALLVAVVLATVAIRAFLRARAAMVVEDRDFARLREIRVQLGIDA
ncbi:MAG: hypothetical protein WCK73_03035 [Deltaproteobacteria bacterium]